MSRWCSNQLSYRRIMVRLIGLEPTTPTMSRWCSNQLSYKRIMVRSIGLEPTTPTMSRWCSNQLSYERNVVVTTGTHISGRQGMWQEVNVTFLVHCMRLRIFYPLRRYFTEPQGYFFASRRLASLFFAGLTLRVRVAVVLNYRPPEERSNKEDEIDWYFLRFFSWRTSAVS